MNKQNDKTYTLNLTSDEMKELGFKYDFELQEYAYMFPVYNRKSKNKKDSIICKLGINEETKQVWINVYNSNGRLYPSYYNRQYGKSNIIPIIDKNIKTEINKLKNSEVM